MTIPGARLRFVITMALIGILPTVALAAVQSGDGSHSFQKSDMQFMSTEGSGYYSFHLYSRFSPTSDGLLSSLAGEVASPKPGPVIVQAPTQADPPVAAEPPNMRRPPGFGKPPDVPEPPVLADDPPPEVPEPSTLLLMGAGLLAAAGVGRRKLG